MIAAFIRRVKDICAGKPSAKRSPHWEEVRKQHLNSEPICQSCGKAEGLEVHHKIPFCIDPSKELLDSNLITLCEVGIKCHLNTGHHGNWKKFNVNVVNDCKENVRALKAKNVYPLK